MTSAALAASAVDITFSPAASAFALLLLPSGRPTTTIEARIAQIQRMRVPLAAVADNGDRLAFEQRKIAVFFVKARGFHFHLFQNSVLF